MAAQMRELSQLTLSVAGTRQRISSSQIIAYSVLVTAASTNTGSVVVGDSSVTATNAGAILSAGKSFQFGPIISSSGGAEKIDLNQIYWDGTSSGDKISVSYSVIA